MVPLTATSYYFCCRSEKGDTSFQYILKYLISEYVQKGKLEAISLLFCFKKKMLKCTIILSVYIIIRSYSDLDCWKWLTAYFHQDTKWWDKTTDSCVICQARTPACDTLWHHMTQLVRCSLATAVHFCKHGPCSGLAAPWLPPLFHSSLRTSDEPTPEVWLQL